MLRKKCFCIIFILNMQAFLFLQGTKLSNILLLNVFLNFCSPTFPRDLIRSRMQLEGAGGHAHVYKTGLLGTFRHIVRNGGSVACIGAYFPSITKLSLVWESCSWPMKSSRIYFQTRSVFRTLVTDNLTSFYSNLQVNFVISLTILAFDPFSRFVDIVSNWKRREEDFCPYNGV